MRVPDALDALDKLVLMSHPSNRTAIEKVLDDLWLTAYREGLEKTFEPTSGKSIEENMNIDWDPDRK